MDGIEILMYNMVLVKKITSRWLQYRVGYTKGLICSLFLASETQGCVIHESYYSQENMVHLSLSEF